MRRLLRLADDHRQALIALILSAFGLVTTTLILTIIIQCSSDSAWRATPRGDGSDVDVAVILGFGYIQPPTGPLEAGRSNTFLFKWVRWKYRRVKILLVQEGVWAAACSPALHACEKEGVTLLRIHKDDPNKDVTTLEAAECAMLRLLELPSFRRRRKALLVAHHLQLWRAQRCFDKVKATLCPECEFIVPDMPDTPFEPCSSQWRTRSERNFRFAEFGGRLRDLSPFSPRIKGSCVAPISKAP